MQGDFEKSKSIDPCNMLISLSIFRNAVEKFECCTRILLEQNPCKKMLHIILEIKESMAVTYRDSFAQRFFSFHRVFSFLVKYSCIAQPDHSLSFGWQGITFQHGFQTS